LRRKKEKKKKTLKKGKKEEPWIAYRVYRKGKNDVAAIAYPSGEKKGGGQLEKNEKHAPADDPSRRRRRGMEPSNYLFL